MDRLILKQNSADIWSIRWRDLHAPEGLELFSAEEKAKAQRKKNPDDRGRFVSGRYALRVLAGRYLDCAPDSLVITERPRGKPFFQCSPGFHYNVSHSGDWVMLAFTAAREIGIDVQYAGGKSDEVIDRVARRSFSSEEYAFFQGLQGDPRRDAFFRFWACKEAVIKAAGLGVHGTLKNFTVLPLPAEERWGRVSATHPDMHNYYDCYAWTPGKDHRAAIALAAVDSGALQVRRYDTADLKKFL